MFLSSHLTLQSIIPGPTLHLWIRKARKVVNWNLLGTSTHSTRQTSTPHSVAGCSRFPWLYSTFSQPPAGGGRPRLHRILVSWDSRMGFNLYKYCKINMSLSKLLNVSKLQHLTYMMMCIDFYRLSQSSSWQPYHQTHHKYLCVSQLRGPTPLVEYQHYTLPAADNMQPMQLGHVPPAWQDQNFKKKLWKPSTFIDFKIVDMMSYKKSCWNGSNMSPRNKNKFDGKVVSESRLAMFHTYLPLWDQVTAHLKFGEQEALNEKVSMYNPFISLGSTDQSVKLWMLGHPHSMRRTTRFAAANVLCCSIISSMLNVPTRPHPIKNEGEFYWWKCEMSNIKL